VFDHRNALPGDDDVTRYESRTLARQEALNRIGWSPPLQARQAMEEFSQFFGRIQAKAGMTSKCNEARWKLSSKTGSRLEVYPPGHLSRCTEGAHAPK
jgi:hypothetical protein